MKSSTIIKRPSAADFNKQRTTASSECCSSCNSSCGSSSSSSSSSSSGSNSCSNSSSSSSGGGTPSPDKIGGKKSDTGIIRAPRPPAKLPRGTELTNEWIETDSLDVKTTSHLASLNQSTTKASPSSTLLSNKNNKNDNVKSTTKSCCNHKNSTSSGYSSHSPQLSSVDPTTTNRQKNNNNFHHHPHQNFHCQHRCNRQNNNLTIVKTLAPISESEIIPRPIWPLSTSDDSSPETADSDEAAAGRRLGNMRRQTSIYGSAGGYEASSSDYSNASSSNSSSQSARSARDVLLELSRTLSSVLEGDCNKSDEEILRDITRAVNVAQVVNGNDNCNDNDNDGNNRRVGDTDDRRGSSSIYEEICRNNGGGSLAGSARESTSTVGVNPINSKLYGHRCYCERSVLCQNRSGTLIQTSPKKNERTTGQRCVPSVFLLTNEQNNSTSSYNLRDYADNNACNCNKVTNKKTTQQQKTTTNNKTIVFKRALNNRDNNENVNEARYNNPSYVEHEYTTLECSDEYSSSAATTTTSDNGGCSKNNTWRTNNVNDNKNFRGFDKNLDFTLDSLHAERLGRALARAKRRRRWCCVFLIFFGLVIFVLVVVVVSLCVTKGRKFFGSM